jgi:hypothetical protein
VVRSVQSGIEEPSDELPSSDHDHHHDGSVDHDHGQGDDYNGSDDIDNRAILNIARDVYDCSVILGCVDYGRSDDDILLKLDAARERLDSAISHARDSCDRGGS